MKSYVTLSVNYCNMSMALRWRHNEHNDVSNHQPHDCLLNHLFRCRSKKTSKFRFTGLCVGNSPVAGELPTQMASNGEKCFHLMTSSWDFLIQKTKHNFNCNKSHCRLQSSFINPDLIIKLCCYVIRSTRHPEGSQRPPGWLQVSPGRWLPKGCLVDHIT